MQKNLKNTYNWLSSLFKQADKLTAYNLGNTLRRLTNPNTKIFWDKKYALSEKASRTFPYENIAEFFPKNEEFTLLDIGCAMGDGCIFLKEKFPLADISGADFSEVAIKKAKKKTDKVRFFVLDILEEIPLIKYDYVVMCSTLEHFNDPYIVVDKCLKFIKKSFIVQVPYEENFSEPKLYSKGLHRYLFNESTFDVYNTEILKITKKIEETGYRYIIYEIRTE